MYGCRSVRGRGCDCGELRQLLVSENHVAIIGAGLGLTEMALIICNSQRGGPSTGLPTNVEQSDLHQAIYGGHGDSPRVVLAAKSVEDCF